MMLISIFNQFSMLENKLNSFLKNNYKITLSEYLLMKYLLDNQNESISINNLKKNIHYKSINMSSRVKELNEKGLLRKIRSNVDERIVKIHLTSMGIELINKILSSDEWIEILDHIDMSLILNLEKFNINEISDDKLN